jgi:endo-1,4-beta-xylanase
MRATIFAIIVLAFGQTDTNAQQQPTLKDAYKGCFLVGAALNPSQVSGEDPRENALVKAQFNSISPENVLKWEIVHPQSDTYDFSLADQYVEFGERNHMFVIGHNLVCHAANPEMGVRR